mmetsp:Transcript_11165/g.45453  ORF Transcript_11165/g.45453 Transcript_11165/m.45453 type:complete len:474 (-) Transcript_11165:75-1496(-)
MQAEEPPCLPEQCCKKEEPEEVDMAESSAEFYFSEFRQLLIRDEFLLARACNRVVVGHEDKDSDAINAMVALFDHYGELLGVVRTVVNADLCTSSGTTLLRENAGSTNIVQGLLGVHRDWLNKCVPLGQFMVRALKAQKKGLADSDSGAVERTCALAREALKVISDLEIPTAIRAACRETARLCVEHGFADNMEDAAQFAVGSIFFLHFACPAIIAITRFSAVAEHMAKKGMAEVPFPSMRGMVMVAKLIQALANGSTAFDNPRMEPYNFFLSEERDTFRSLCSAVVNYDGDDYDRFVLDEDRLLRRWKLVFRFAKRRKAEVEAKALELGAEEVVARVRDDLAAAIASVAQKRELAASAMDIRDRFAASKPGAGNGSHPELSGCTAAARSKSSPVSSPSMKRRASAAPVRAGRFSGSDEMVGLSPRKPTSSANSPKAIAKSLFRRKSNDRSGKEEKKKKQLGRKSSLSGRYGL